MRRTIKAGTRNFKEIYSIGVPLTMFFSVLSFICFMLGISVYGYTFAVCALAAFSAIYIAIFQIKMKWKNCFEKYRILLFYTRTITVAIILTVTTSMVQKYYEVEISSVKSMIAVLALMLILNMLAFMYKLLGFIKVIKVVDIRDTMHERMKDAGVENKEKDVKE